MSFRSVMLRHPTLLVLYTIFGIHSFLFQASIRLEQCKGFAGCSLSLAKDVVWSLVWPIYWVGYFFIF
jgi:hypothetical protein